MGTENTTQGLLELFLSEWLTSPLPFSKQPAHEGEACSLALLGTIGEVDLFDDSGRSTRKPIWLHSSSSRFSNTIAAILTSLSSEP